MRASQPPDLARREQGEGGENEPDRLLDLQRDALETAGVDEVDVYDDLVSGVGDDRPGPDSCRRVLRNGDVLVVWKLHRLGRNLARLVDAEQNRRSAAWACSPATRAQSDTTTAGGRLVFGIFAALAEFNHGITDSHGPRTHGPTGDRVCRSVSLNCPPRLPPADCRAWVECSAIAGR